MDRIFGFGSLSFPRPFFYRLLRPFLLLLVFLLLIGVWPLATHALVFQDYGGVEDGALPSGWTQVSGASGSVAASSGALRVVDASSSTQSYASWTAPISGTQTLDFDLVRTSGVARVALGSTALGGTNFNNTSIFHLIFQSDGSVDYYKGSAYSLAGAGAGKVPAGIRVHVRLCISYGSAVNAATLYLDGVSVGALSGVAWASRGKLPDRLMLGSGSGSGTGDEFIVDNVRVSQLVEPPAVFGTPGIEVVSAGSPVSITHAVTGGGSEMGYSYRVYRYDASLDRFLKVTSATTSVDGVGAEWSFPARMSGTYQLQSEVRLDGGVWLEDSDTSWVEVPVKALTMSVQALGEPAGGVRVLVGGGFAGTRSQVWLLRETGDGRGWVRVKGYGDAFSGADGGTSWVDVLPDGFAAGELPNVGETCSMRVETLTDEEYMVGVGSASGVHGSVCTVEVPDLPRLEGVLVSSATGRTGSLEPLEATLVRPAGGVLRFTAGCAGFADEDVDFTLRLVPDAESGPGAAGDTVLDADIADVGSGARTGTLEWDTTDVPSGTYLLSVSSAGHGFFSTRSATRFCLVTLTRVGEVIPELDSETPIVVTMLDSGETWISAYGTGLASAFVKVWLSTPFGGLGSSAGVGSSASTLNMELPGFGIYRADVQVRRAGLKTYDDAATLYFPRLRSDPVRIVSVTASADGGSLTSGATVSPGTRVTFTGAAGGGGGGGAEGEGGPSEDLASGYAYSYWTEDSEGWHMLRGWSVSPDWSFSPTDPGLYSVVMFAKGADGQAGSYEASWSTQVRVAGAPDLGGYQLVKAVGLADSGPGASGDEESGDGSLTGVGAGTGISSRTAVRLSVEVDPDAVDEKGSALAGAAKPEGRLYQFEVIDAHLYTMLRGFSPDPTCLWIPRKAGTYTILVHIRDTASGGFEDVHTVVEDVVVG